MSCRPGITTLPIIPEKYYLRKSFAFWRIPLMVQTRARPQLLIGSALSPEETGRLFARLSTKKRKKRKIRHIHMKHPPGWSSIKEVKPFRTDLHEAEISGWRNSWIGMRCRIRWHRTKILLLIGTEERKKESSGRKHPTRRCRKQTKLSEKMRRAELPLPKNRL